jgi:hypothetical protein
MCSVGGCSRFARAVSSFGHPRIDACTRLPGAYRSVPRPSSALGAKAFTDKLLVASPRDAENLILFALLAFGLQISLSAYIINCYSVFKVQLTG